MRCQSCGHSTGASPWPPLVLGLKWLAILWFADNVVATTATGAWLLWFFWWGGLMLGCVFLVSFLVTVGVCFAE